MRSWEELNAARRDIVRFRSSFAFRGVADATVALPTGLTTPGGSGAITRSGVQMGGAFPHYPAPVMAGAPGVRDPPRMVRRAVTIAALAAAFVVVPPVFAGDMPRTKTEPGEPAVPEDTERNLPGTYEETPGTHAERPGKHSTTAGRHGTSGTAGGGVNTESGSEAAPKDYRVPDEAPPPD